MKRRLINFGSVFLLITLVGCATLQDQWNKLTPDEQARVIIKGFQRQVTNLLISTEAYVKANPKYAENWKNKILPSAELVKQMLDVLIDLKTTPKLTPDLVYSKVQPLMNNLILFIGEIGASTEVK